MPVQQRRQRLLYTLPQFNCAAAGTITGSQPQLESEPVLTPEALPVVFLLIDLRGRTDGVSG